VWVGAWALTEGIMNIWAAFRIRSVNRQAAALATPAHKPGEATA
jgi:hypothetical protein